MYLAYKQHSFVSNNKYIVQNSRKVQKFILNLYLTDVLILGQTYSGVLLMVASWRSNNLL